MALTFSDKANIEKGVTIGTAVTLQEQIGACIRDVGGRILKGSFTLATIPNATSLGVSQDALNECGLRMSRGNLQQELMPHVLADSNVTNGTPSDSVIENAVTWAVAWIAILITRGKM